MTAESLRRSLVRAALGSAGISLFYGLANARTGPLTGRLESSRTLRVGPTRAIKTLREASQIARDGDEILVDPGGYPGDVAVWTQRGLVIRADSGIAVMAASGASAEGKGTFVFRGGDATVENMAFTGARARDRNGAGIRLDVGATLTVKACRFEDNENGILTSNDTSSVLNLVDSEFSRNGAGDGQSHNLYVGTIAKLTVNGCYFSRARVGHLLKSRARESHIAYSRLSGEDGTSSYELEFPSGGRAVVVGCLIQQGPASENSTIIAIGAEGYRWQKNELLLSFSTIVNDRARGGTFVRAAAGPVRAEVVDNLLVGPGAFEVQPEASVVRNLEARRTEFKDPARLDYRLRRSSRLIGAAGLAGAISPDRALPEHEYVHPASSVHLGRISPLSPISPGAFQRIAP